MMQAQYKIKMQAQAALSKATEEAKAVTDAEEAKETENKGPFELIDTESQFTSMSTQS